MEEKIDEFPLEFIERIENRVDSDNSEEEQSFHRQRYRFQSIWTGYHSHRGSFTRLDRPAYQLRCEAIRDLLIENAEKSHKVYSRFASVLPCQWGCCVDHGFLPRT